jgi:hypothetical protein
MRCRSGRRAFADALVAAAVFAAAAMAPLGAEAASPERAVKGEPSELTVVPGLPDIGLWMLTREGTVADWLGAPHQGKKLLEPINVIIVDPFAASEADAVARLIAACEKAEFETREGHSGGYSALIGAETCPQFPPGTEESFSDAPFAVGNNHGRIFGPVAWKGIYIFTAAFSREGVDLVTKVKHYYESFDRARDAFTQKLSAKTDYRVSSLVYLGNDLISDDALTTGDHDGMAVLLKAIR